jgi:hypothetical protein
MGSSPPCILPNHLRPDPHSCLRFGPKLFATITFLHPTGPGPGYSARIRVPIEPRGHPSARLTGQKIVSALDCESRGDYSRCSLKYLDDDNARINRGRAQEGCSFSRRIDCIHGITTCVDGLVRRRWIGDIAVFRITAEEPSGEWVVVSCAEEVEHEVGVVLFAA